MQSLGSLKTVVRALVAVVLAVVLAGCLSLSQNQALSALNLDRAIYGRLQLPDKGDVQAKAQAWADKLARENSLYHSNLSDGIHTRWCSLGENVGYGADISSIELAYMLSPEHRDNILATRYNGVGVGVARNGSRVWVVQEFIQNC